MLQNEPVVETKVVKKQIEIAIKVWKIKWGEIASWKVKAEKKRKKKKKILISFL